jgi:hypothetical protein
MTASVRSSKAKFAFLRINGKVGSGDASEAKAEGMLKTIAKRKK